jgi:hypothetical protein
MSQYLLAVNGSAADAEAQAQMTAEDMQSMYAAVEVYNQKLRAEGAWVFAGGLQPIESTTTVDNTGAETVITDGPFVESKEWIGGFWVIEAPDLDAALRWAAEGSKACAGRVEVRPFQDEPEA